MTLACSSLSAKKIKAIRREFSRLPTAQLPASGHLACLLCLPSHYRRWTKRLLSKANPSTWTCVLILFFQYPSHWSVNHSLPSIITFPPLFLIIPVRWGGGARAFLTLLSSSYCFSASLFFGSQSSQMDFSIVPPKQLLSRSSVTSRLPYPMVSSQSSSY